MTREEAIRKLIEDLQLELEGLTNIMTWEEACKYMYDHKANRMRVCSTSDGGIYHSFEGIGILYAKHAIKGKSDTYRKM